MKISVAFVLLSSALAVAAVPTKAGMDDSSNAMVDAISNAVASNVKNLLKKASRATISISAEEVPHTLEDPVQFMVN